MGVIHRDLQLMNKDPERSIALFWAASEEAIKAIISMFHSCSGKSGQYITGFIQEAVYRKALSMEPDNIKSCNLGICLMHQGRVAEAKINSTKRLHL